MTDRKSKIKEIRKRNEFNEQYYNAHGYDGSTQGKDIKWLLDQLDQQSIELKLCYRNIETQRKIIEELEAEDNSLTYWALERSGFYFGLRCGRFTLTASSHNSLKFHSKEQAEEFRSAIQEIFKGHPNFSINMMKYSITEHIDM